MMADNYFIEYKTEQKTEPYILPDEIRDELNSIEGLCIQHEGKYKPIVIAAIPMNKVDTVKSLDCVVDVHKSTQFQHFVKE